MIGQTKDVGFQVGARRTLSVPLADAWTFLTSQEGVTIWLGKPLKWDFIKGEDYQLKDGTTGLIRVLKENSHLRMTWKPPEWEKPSLIQIRVIPKGEKTVIAFHQEHLPGPEERQMRKDFFIRALDRIEEIIY